MSDARIRLALAAILVTILLASVFALQACSETDVPETDAAAESSEGEGTGADDAVPEDTEGEDMTQFHESEVEVAGSEIVVITTPKGTIKFEFFTDDAPNTVASFIELADKGFYDGTKFHRVEPGFVIQGGDPKSKTDDPMVGTGGPGYYLRAEFNDKPHVDGTVAMARSQSPDSAGSQFYITMGAQPFLDGKYTVFGQVTEGLDVVYEIEVGDVMESVRVERPE